MYHPTIVQRRLDKLIDQARLADPQFTIRDYTLPDIEQWLADLDKAWDPHHERLRRELKEPEKAFIRQELYRAKADYRHFAETYAWIKTKNATLERVRFWESQQILINRVAKAEFDSYDGKTGDGIMLAVLKARQLGASTFTETAVAHRAIFYGNLTALIAGDTPEQSAYLFDMTERIYDHLPWWMKPKLTYHVKDQQMFFGDQDSLILTAAALSTRGGDSGMQQGSMGTGKTLPVVHLSELPLWQNPYQIDDSLMPSIPETPNTLGIFEGTAKGRGNWWHVTWNKAEKGLSRLQPCFIPWYAESKTYRKPAPANWQPSRVAIAHAQQVLEDSPRWCGRTVQLDRDQLFWWEMKRAEYVESNVLNKFLAEYASNPATAFQHTTESVFPSEVLHHLQMNAKPIMALCDVLNMTEIPKRKQAVNPSEQRA